jgi:hypothetical protein
VGRPTKQEIEAREANRRINAYLSGGSRLVLISRAVVGGLIIVIMVVLWWQGLFD